MQPLQKCPPEEDLAAFIDRALPPERNGEVETHLAECRHCRDVVALTIRSSGDE